MPRESKAKKAERFRNIIARLEEAIPEAKIALDYTTELELLVAVMLSAQCTDKLVNTVTPALFARFPSARAYARSASWDSVFEGVYDTYDVVLAKHGK